MVAGPSSPVQTTAPAAQSLAPLQVGSFPAPPRPDIEICPTPTSVPVSTAAAHAVSNNDRTDKLHNDRLRMGGSQWIAGPMSQPVCPIAVSSQAAIPPVLRQEAAARVACSLVRFVTVVDAIRT